MGDRGRGAGSVLKAQVDRKLLGEPGMVLIVAEVADPVPVVGEGGGIERGVDRGRLLVIQPAGRNLERHHLSEDLSAILGGDDRPMAEGPPVSNSLDLVVNGRERAAGAHEVRVQRVRSSTALDRGARSNESLGQQLASVHGPVSLGRRAPDEVIDAITRLDRDDVEELVDVHALLPR